MRIFKPPLLYHFHGAVNTTKEDMFFFDVTLTA
jgi:hypothetical protein